MGQTIGFPTNAAKLDRSQLGAKRRIERKLARESIDSPRSSNGSLSPLNEVDALVDPTVAFLGLSAPVNKRDYQVYMRSATLRAGFFPHNREYRFIERSLPGGQTETIYSGPNFLDSRTVIENADGVVVGTIRANHMGNGVVEVRYFDDGAYITEHQASEDQDNFSYHKDAQGRITRLELADGTALSYGYEGDSHVAHKFTDSDGVEWMRCPSSGIFKNELGDLLLSKPVQMVAANETGSYMFASYGRFSVTHRTGETEERYFPTARDLLDQGVPVTVAFRFERDRLRAEQHALALREEYKDADVVVMELPVEHIDGDVVDGRHVSRFY